MAKCDEIVNRLAVVKLLSLLVVHAVVATAIIIEVGLR
jgi:hypothetical protein